MKAKGTFLILCFLLFSLSNGYRVRRNDNSAENLIDPVIDANENDDSIHNDIDVDLHEGLEEDIHEDIHEDPQEDQNEIHHENNNEEDDEELLEIQLIVTDPVPDVGVDGDLENTDLPIDGELENNDIDIDGDLENTDLPIDGDLDNTDIDIDLAEICDGSKMFLPNAQNCSLFYDCNNKEGSSCPQGMWFDPNYIGDIFCNYPEVICAADNDICDCAEKYPPPPADPLIEQSVSCLKDNRFHLIPSQINCGRYFICHNEMTYRMECRQGLHYNSKTEMCDYPEVVNCRIPDPDCPTEGIQFLPDTTRCEVFYFCVHGFKTKQVCPFYHIWDIRSNSCRRQDEAICHLEQ